MVQVDAVQQIHTTNKFVALQMEDEANERNQLAIVEEGDVQNTPTQKVLNPDAAVFTPKSTGVASSKRGNVQPNGEKNLSKPAADGGKETTLQWVNRTFPDPKVTTNQSCQEITFQSLDTSIIPEQENLKDRVNFTGGRLWDQKHEEESDEGEFLEGHEDVEEVHDKDPDVEEQSVNGKSSRFKIQSAEEGINVNTTDEHQIEQPSNKITPSLNSNHTSSPIEAHEPSVQSSEEGDLDDPGDLGDKRGEVQQQQLVEVQKKVDLELQQNMGTATAGDNVTLTQMQEVVICPNHTVEQMKNISKSLVLNLSGIS
ncbi:hypothetical protein A4A49_35477 [Nicotiana attenuata]|uniref:Uncharacterized protein n=1 Tax=Nicotiana attenuata TaxID=49451 RepID=A0A1J6KS58_NICAT|nr:hypothetical protein A4A49_35477 [Nicotiana attenuata]